MSQLVEEIVKSGQRHHLSSALLMWESTTTAGTQMGCCLLESGVGPLTQINYGNSVLSQYVTQHTAVRKVIQWVPAM